MAAASQVSRTKRGRDDYWNGGFALPDTKRINSGLTVAQDSDFMLSLDEINNLDDNDCNPEETDAANELEISETRVKGVIQSLEDEIGLNVQTEHKIQFSDENCSPVQMGSFRQGELVEDGSNSEVTSVNDIGDWTYYDDLRAQLGCFVENISPEYPGIIIDNYVNGDSMVNLMYSDAIQGYAESTEDFYWSLWDHDIWQPNEHPVIRNGFESSQQEEIGLVVSEADFPDVWNDIRPVQGTDDKKAL